VGTIGWNRRTQRGKHEGGGGGGGSFGCPAESDSGVLVALPPVGTTQTTHPLVVRSSGTRKSEEPQRLLLSQLEHGPLQGCDITGGGNPTSEYNWNAPLRRSAEPPRLHINHRLPLLVARSLSRCLSPPLSLSVSLPEASEDASLPPRHAAVHSLLRLITMDSALTGRGYKIEGVEEEERVVPRRSEDVTVVFQNRHNNRHHDDDDDDADTCTVEEINLQTNRMKRNSDEDGGDEGEEATTTRTSLCPQVMCFTGRHAEDHTPPGASFGNGRVACVLNE